MTEAFERGDFTQLHATVIAPGLCTRCGACAGICPHGAITIASCDSLPVVDASLCTHCGRCLPSCPGQGYPVTAWTAARGAPADADPTWGPVHGIWRGYACDAEIRAAAASGGIATALLCYCLAAGLVDEVVVVTLEAGQPVVRFTDDPAVVTAAVGSKYAPVPLLQTVLPALRERPRRIALTATPCQLAGWYRATTLLPRLREYLVLAIGLFCGHVQTTDSLTAIGSTINVRYPDAATFVGWRCGPYPGCARFVTPEGEVREKPLYPWLDIAVPFFTPQRCFLCPDGGNWLSDLTLGDIHAGGTDETVVIARTAHGQQVLAAARDAGVLTYTAMTDAEKRATVVTGITRSKLRAGLERIAWHQRKGLPAPEFDYAPAVMCRAKIPGQTPGLLKYLLAMWWRHPGRLAWLRRHPRLLEWLGRQLYRFPTALPGYRLLRRLRRG